MNNKLTDLNNYLFEQLERLTDELEGEKLQEEIQKSKAICDISKNIIDNAHLQLNTIKYINETYFNEIATKTISKQLLGIDYENKV